MSLSAKMHDLFTQFPLEAKMSKAEAKSLRQKIEAMVRECLADDSSPEQDISFAKRVLREMGYDEHEEHRAIKAVARHFHTNIPEPVARRSEYSQELGFHPVERSVGSRSRAL
jgi:hypothetical protein